MAKKNGLQYYYFLYANGAIGRSDKKLSELEARDMVEDYEAVQYLSEAKVKQLAEFKAKYNSGSG